MAIREIKATLALDGEKKFKAGLDDASRSLRVMDTGLKAIEASYGNTGDKSTMLAKKSEVLKQELEQQKRIVTALSGAVQESAQKYGDTAKQTDGYRIKLNNALKKQAEMEKAIRDTEREMDELGRESKSVGREIEQGVGDAAEEASKSLKGMYDQLKGDIDVLKGSAVASAISDVGGFVVNAVSGVMDFLESNRDYRTQQSFTEQQIRDAGLELQNTMGLIYEVASFTGDLDGAREALSNLLGVGFSLEELQTVLANLTGLHIQNPESFKIETMAESLRESIQQAEATGVFADYLMSLSDVFGKPSEQIVEEFNKAMDAAEDLEERQAVAMHFLGQGGGVDTKVDFAAREKELVEARAAQIELANAWAEVAEEIEPIVTDFQKKAAEIVTGMAGAISAMKSVLQGEEPDIYGPGGLEGAIEDTNKAIEEYEKKKEETKPADKAWYERFGEEWVKFWGIQGESSWSEKELAEEQAEIDASLAEAEANRQRMIAEAKAAEEAAEAAKKVQEVAPEAEKEGAKTVADEWAEINASLAEAEANRQRMIAEAQAAEEAAEAAKKVQEVAPEAEKEGAKTVADEWAEINASLAEAEANRQRMIAEAQAAEEAAEAAKEAQEVASEAEKEGAKTVADEWEEINASIAEAEANRQRMIAEAQAAEAAAAEAAEMMAEEEGSWLSNLWKKITGQDKTEEELKNKGSDAVESVQNGMEAAEPAASSAAQTAGNNIATATANGIIAGTPGAVSAAAAMVDGVNAELLRLGNPFGGNLTNGLYDRPAAGPVSRNASASASGGGTIVVPLYMDSSKVGEAVIPSVSAGMGSQIKQLISIG